jgi:hypothetical protein
MGDLASMGINPPPQPQGGGMGGGQGGGMGGGGMNPGGIEAVRAAVQKLKSMGLSDQEILDAILSMLEAQGMSGDEEKIMQMITGVGPEGPQRGQGGPPQGGMPQGSGMQGGMPPTGGM